MAVIEPQHGRWPVSRGPGAIEYGGGPPHDGGMEARVAKLESDIQHVVRTLDELKADGRAHRDALVRFSSEVNGEFRAVRKEMRDDFRLLFGAIIAVALSLAGLMAKGFGWL